MYMPQFVHYSTDGHMDSFHILAIVNDAAMDIGRHVSEILFSYIQE